MDTRSVIIGLVVGLAWVGFDKLRRMGKKARLAETRARVDRLIWNIVADVSASAARGEKTSVHVVNARNLILDLFDEAAK